MEEELDDELEPVSVEVTVLLELESLLELDDVPLELDVVPDDDVPDVVLVDAVFDVELIPPATMDTPIALARRLPAAIATVAFLATFLPRSLAFMSRCSGPFLGGSYGPSLRDISIGERDRLEG